MAAADDPGLPAGLPADEEALRRLHLLLSAAIAGLAAVEAAAQAQQRQLQASVVFDDGAPVLVLDVIEEARP
jgi:hypothetical protein